MPDARANSLPGKSKNFVITTLHATGPEDRIFPPARRHASEHAREYAGAGEASILFTGPHPQETACQPPLADTTIPHMVCFAYSFFGRFVGVQRHALEMAMAPLEPVGWRGADSNEPSRQI
jgi:hypothetical protein